jgi:TRAP transporter 4TM/12TM fusion protein
MAENLIDPDTETRADTSSAWDYEGKWKIAVYTLSTLLTVWLLYYLYTGKIPRTKYGVLHLGGAILLLSVLMLAERWQVEDKTTRGWLSIGLFTLYAVAGVAAAIYIFVEFEALQRDRLVNYLLTDYIAGLVLIWVSIDYTWRTYGNVVTGVVLFSIVYALFGNLFPGVFTHGGLEFTRFVPAVSIEFEGVLGSVFLIIATWVYIYVLYGGIIRAFGGIELFVQVASRVSNYFKRGVPQVGVIASMFMGSLMGASIANVATTGAFTIPLMKRHGIRGRTAGAIESIASTGGQILPPVMASVAFLIAQRVGLRYADVVVAAVLPALLFYLVVGVSVYIFSIREGVEGTLGTKVDLENVGVVIPLVLSLGVLIYMLVVERRSAGFAGLYTVVVFTATAVAVEIIQSPTVETAKKSITKIFDGFVHGTVAMVPLSIFIAAIAIVVRVLSITGLANKIALRILEVGGGHLFTIAVLVMVVSLLFGLGMPTLPAYLLTVTLTEYALTNVGVDPLVANFFIFYSAILSAVTPPVAIAAAVGAKIAEAEFIPTAIRAFVLGFPTYGIPFLFLYRPELVLVSFPDSLVTFVLSSVLLAVLVLMIHGVHMAYTRRRFGVNA